MQRDLEDRDSLASAAAAASIEKTAAGWGDLLGGRNGIYALALAGGVVLHAVNVFIATTVMPSVVIDIGGMDLYAWATTLFVVASILGAALAAKLLKAAGPRGAYLVATLVFATGTLVCSLAINMPLMLVGRAVQGMGGGFLYALAYALTRVVLPERLWGRAIALVSAMWGVATLVGPAVGGAFAEFGAWRAAFWTLMPFAAAFAVLALATLPRHSPDRNERSSVPFLQLVLLTGAVLAVSTGSLFAEAIWNLAGLAAGVLLLAIIAAIDAGARARLLPRRSFHVGTPLGALYLTVAMLMLAMQPEIFVPYLLQHLHGQSPLWAGYLAATMSLGWTAATLITSRWQESRAARLIVAGPMLTLAGLALLAVFLPVEGGGSWWLLAPICLGLVLIGFGIGTAWPVLVTSIFRNAPAAEQDLAAGGVTTVQMSAMAFGAAAAGMVANVAGIADPGGVAGAANAALWLVAIFALGPAVAVAMTPRVIRLAGGAITGSQGAR